MNIRIISLVAGISCALVASQSWAALFGGGDDKLERRVARLEQMSQKGDQGDLAMQLQRLQLEIQQLRGELEIQGHALDAMKRRQNDLYNDVDQRLRVLGGEPSSTPQASGGGTSGMDAPQLQLDSNMQQPPAVGMGAAAPVPATGEGDPLQDQAPDPHQEAAYQASFELLKKGEYQNAAESFKSFLAAYPQGPHSDKAQYWLGEAFYVMQDYDAALAEFNKLVANYPYSSKVADSLLKISYVYYEKKNWSRAKDLLTKIVQEHPGSSAAAQATKRLDMMRGEGH